MSTEILERDAACQAPCLGSSPSSSWALEGPKLICKLTSVRKRRVWGAHGRTHEHTCAFAHGFTVAGRRSGTSSQRSWRGKLRFRSPLQKLRPASEREPETTRSSLYHELPKGQVFNDMNSQDDIKITCLARSVPKESLLH